MALTMATNAADKRDSSSDKFQVYAKVSTPQGVFTGFASGDIDDFDQACGERDGIQEMLRNCDCFTFFSDTTPGCEISLYRDVIQSSVFELMVVKGLAAA